MKEQYAVFIQKLEKLFGKFEEDRKRFEKASNSEIARKVGYSDSQLSRLIHKSATKNEYQRAIQNIERMLIISELERKEKSGVKPRKRKFNVWLIFTFFLLVGLIFYLIYIGNIPTKNHNEHIDTHRDYTLKWAFESSFVRPYVKLKDLPKDCNYPCYKYQGKWELKNGYKIPLYRSGYGFHYLATEVKMYAQCKNKIGNGNILVGYEYQKHEIWYDKRQLPIDSFIIDNKLKDSYKNIEFKNDTNFVKVATVHTFFRNEFRIDSAYIYRTGKVIGRDVEFVESEALHKEIKGEETIHDIEDALYQITRNLLKDFSRPISCFPAPVPAINFHLVKDGDIISFDCQLTTHRVPINYTKTYILKDQFIKIDCRSKGK